jgi:hypothetical protein
MNVTWSDYKRIALQVRYMAVKKVLGSYSFDIPKFMSTTDNYKKMKVYQFRNLK